MQLSDIPNVITGNTASYIKAVQTVRDALVDREPLRFAVFFSLLQYEFHHSAVPSELQACLLTQELFNDGDAGDAIGNRVSAVVEAVIKKAQSDRRLNVPPVLEGVIGGENLRLKPALYNPYEDSVFMEASEQLQTRYEIYFAHANDGEGGDLSNPNHYLKTFSEWLNN
jgi:hypothetical protein